MLALTAATHGQDPTQILTVLAAVGVAIFWRFVLKIALALLIIVLLILFLHLLHGEAGLLQDLRTVLK